MTMVLSGAVAAALILWGLRLAHRRLLLSRAKHPSLQGHVRLAKRLARLVPLYEHTGERFFDSDGAPPDVALQRRTGFDRLANDLEARARHTIAAGDGHRARRLRRAVHQALSRAVSVPALRCAQRLRVGSLLEAGSGVTVTNLDGRTDYDVSGSYGVNVFGTDFYRECIDAGIDHVRRLGPVLGPYHPVIGENVRRLQGDLGPGRGVVPHVGHRGGHAGRAAGAIPHRPIAPGPLLRRLPRLVGRCAARARQSGDGADDLHARGNESTRP